jgi:hypothetical protein
MAAVGPRGQAFMGSHDERFVVSLPVRWPPLAGGQQRWLLAVALAVVWLAFIHSFIHSTLFEATRPIDSVKST